MNKSFNRNKGVTNEKAKQKMTIYNRCDALPVKDILISERNRPKKNYPSLLVSKVFPHFSTVEAAKGLKPFYVDHSAEGWLIIRNLMRLINKNDLFVTQRLRLASELVLAKGAIV